MDWQTIREQYPRRWVVVEAVEAHTEGEKRVIADLSIVKMFGEDWQPAWEFYKQVHHEDKWREYYVLHTDRPELNIGVMDAFGRVNAE